MKKEYFRRRAQWNHMEVQSSLMFPESYKHFDMANGKWGGGWGWMGSSIDKERVGSILDLSSRQTYEDKFIYLI